MSRVSSTVFLCISCLMLCLSLCVYAQEDSAPTHPVDGECIREWLVLGPFQETDLDTDFLASEPSPQEIIAFHLPDDLQQRLDDLLDKNGEDLLTPLEREELLEFLNVDEMFSLLKTKLKLKLKKQSE